MTRRPIAIVAVLAGLLAVLVVAATRPGMGSAGALVGMFLVIRGVGFVIGYRRR